MEKPQNETVPTSGHKFILNRWKFTLSTVIGYIWIIGIVIAFYKMSGGQLLGLIHLAEVVGVIGITFGVLFFSFGTAAFKAWLVPFGVGVPEKEDIIERYITICKHSIVIIILAGAFVTICGMVNTLGYIDPSAGGMGESITRQIKEGNVPPGTIMAGETPLLNLPLTTSMIAAALTGFVLSLFLVLAIVIPTKLKLQSLLTDRKAFETEQRE